MYGRSLVVRGEGDELCEGWCQVDGHQDHRVEARDPAAKASPWNTGGPTGFYAGNGNILIWRLGADSRKKYSLYNIIGSLLRRYELICRFWTKLVQIQSALPRFCGELVDGSSLRPLEMPVLIFAVVHFGADGVWSSWLGWCSLHSFSSLENTNERGNVHLLISSADGMGGCLLSLAIAQACNEVIKEQACKLKYKLTEFISCSCCIQTATGP